MTEGLRALEELFKGNSTQKQTGKGVYWQRLPLLNLIRKLNLTDKQKHSRGRSPRFLKKATKNDFLYDGNFHEAVGPGEFDSFY